MKAISLTEKCEVSKDVAPGNYLCEVDFVPLLRQLSYMLYEELRCYDPLEQDNDLASLAMPQRSCGAQSK